MHGDFTRMTFDAHNRFSRVLLEQGRPQIEADFNEQVSVLHHYLRRLAADIIGPYGGPKDQAGFLITPQEKGGRDFRIGRGVYYVDGLLCENHFELGFTGQPDFPLTGAEDPAMGVVTNPDGKFMLDFGRYLVYLEVFERHVTPLEFPGMREVALGGPYTASRAKLVFQVKTHALEVDGEIGQERIGGLWPGLVATWQPVRRGMLKAQAKRNKADEDPCILSAKAEYRGPENQLYRVEIDRGGPAGQAAFKWSRDNGSVVFPIRDLKGNRASLDHLGMDDRQTLTEGDWVEVLDVYALARAEPGAMATVESVDRMARTVTLKPRVGETVATNGRAVMLRRWEGYQAVSETDGAWLELEDGVQIQFQPQGHTYRPGDYWLIPARVATGDVEWPRNSDGPVALPPRGERHYAPLALLNVSADGTSVPDGGDLRCIFESFCLPPGGARG